MNSFRQATIKQLQKLRGQAWDDIADISLREGRIKLKRAEAMREFDAQLLACDIDASAAKKDLGNLNESIRNLNSWSDQTTPEGTSS